jgi:hypothetical protein
MSFVPGYEHDVFVSYAHIDDRPSFEPRAGEEPPLGWVGTLVRYLKNQLGQNLGRSDACKLWFDNQSLRGNHLLNDEIAARLERSATFGATCRQDIWPRRGAATSCVCSFAVPPLTSRGPHSL